MENQLAYRQFLYFWPRLHGLLRQFLYIWPRALRASNDESYRTVEFYKLHVTYRLTRYLGPTFSTTLLTYHLVLEIL